MRGGAVTWLVVQLAVSGTGHAQAPDARELSARAIEHFHKLEYEQALTDFTASYALNQLPELLYNIAQTQRLLGHCDEARVQYRQYLALAPRGRLRRAAEAHLANAAACHEREADAAAASPEPQPPSATDVPAATSPDTAVAPVPPPPAAQTTTAPSPAVNLTLAAPKRTTPSLRRRPLFISAIVTAGATLGLAAVGTYYSVEAAARGGDVARIIHAGGTWTGTGPSLDAEGHRDEVTARALFGVAAAGALAAAALTVSAYRSPRVTVRAAVSHAQGILSCVGSF
jgi:hypothetical protein